MTKFIPTFTPTFTPIFAPIFAPGFSPVRPVGHAGHTSPAQGQCAPVPRRGFWQMALAAGALAVMGIGICIGAGPAAGLTLKTGEVMAKDGSIHVGASPRNKANMIANANRRDEPAGVFGNNVYVVVGDSITFVPTLELRGKTKESMVAVVGDAVVQEITGLTEVSFEEVMAVSKISESSGVEIDKLLDTEELASLDPETLKDIEEFSTETGLSVENLVAVNSVLEKLPADQVEHFVDELETMVENGLADEVEKFMSDLSEIEGGAEAFFGFDGYDECVAGGGGGVCDQIQAAHDQSGLE